MQSADKLIQRQLKTLSEIYNNVWYCCLKLFSPFDILMISLFFVNREVIGSFLSLIKSKMADFGLLSHHEIK